MRVYNIVFENNQPMNVTFQGMPLQLNQMFGYSIQCVWTGVPNGKLKLQCSDDANYSGTSPSHWTDIPASEVTISAAGNYMWNVTDVMYNWVRLVYTDLSAGASPAIMTTATFNGKGN